MTANRNINNKLMKVYFVIQTALAQRPDIKITPKQSHRQTLQMIPQDYYIFDATFLH